jgi:release factor glutamine methyltransferase
MKLLKLQKRLSKNEIYSPAEDTFFLEDTIKNEVGKSALDIGSGSGYLTRTLTKNFEFVIGTDINFAALRNQRYKTSNLVCCDGCDALVAEFDLIICNMPYLSSEQIDDVATDGGKDGIEIPIQIIKSAKNCLKKDGKFLFVTSSLSNFKKLIEETKKEGLDAQILAKKKLFFEELIIIKARKIC